MREVSEKPYIQISETLSDTLRIYFHWSFLLILPFFTLEITRELMWLIITSQTSISIILVYGLTQDVKYSILVLLGNYTIWIFFLWASTIITPFIAKKSVSNIENLERKEKILNALKGDLVAGSLTYILIAAGFMLFILPGIFFLLLFILIPQIATFEEANPLKLIVRSREIIQITAKKSIPIFVILGFLVFIMQYILSAIANLIITTLNIKIDIIATVILNSLIFSIPLPMIAIAATLIVVNMLFERPKSAVPVPPIYVSPMRHIKESIFSKKQEVKIQRHKNGEKNHLKREAAEAFNITHKGMKEYIPCAFCGQKIERNAIFCPYCGKKVR